jgi:hypothetical protein
VPHDRRFGDWTLETAHTPRTPSSRRNGRLAGHEVSISAQAVPADRPSTVHSCSGELAIVDVVESTPKGDGHDGASAVTGV